MKRLGSIGPRQRIVAQLGLLAGVGLAFVGGVEPPRLEAAPKKCVLEGKCTIVKPLFGIVLDYSTSMNMVFDELDPNPVTNTRWSGAKKAIKIVIDSDNGYIAEHFILALIRYGHDPDPNVPGSTIPTDTSGLVDGQKLDVPWYDPDVPQKPYFECSNGDAILAALAATDPPSGGDTVGIGGWTRGALDFTADYIATTRADHPEDMGQRPAVVMLIMDGPWQNPQGNLNFAPPTENPNPSAAALFTEQGVPTYVVAFGTALDEKYPDDLALAGGTTAALHAADPTALGDALEAVIVDIQTDVVAPVCAASVPRIMLLLDASSSMLNLQGSPEHAPPGQGGWDQIRSALAGDASMFDIVLDNNNKVEDLVHVGLAVFGHNNPEEQKLVVQYGPCRKDNINWALDPASSCEAPRLRRPLRWPTDHVDLPRRLRRGSARLRRQDPQPHAEVRLQRAKLPTPASAPAPSPTSASTSSTTISSPTAPSAASPPPSSPATTPPSSSTSSSPTASTTPPTPRSSSRSPRCSPPASPPA
jgi:hypothetical protein